MSKIPFHIISGFLGSGKTTFLKRIIENYAGEYKIGIIQNEFAPVNIDGVELKNSGKDFELLEINNGSVFCVCLLGDFVRSLEKFIDKHKPEMLIIEASGLSDTTSVAEVVSSGSLSEKIYLASNWCIVDAINFGRVGFMQQRVFHQIRMADFVVINKTDLIKDGTETLQIEIKKMNPFAKIIESSFCNFEFGLGNKTLNKLYFGEMKTLPRPEINSMVIKTTRKVKYELLVDFLTFWAAKSFRIKGFVNLADNTVCAVQCVFDKIQIQQVDPGFFPTELVALTENFTLREWNKAFRELC
ncbi:MAG: GTP-binding protein [Draconibacterium sp.]